MDIVIEEISFEEALVFKEAFVEEGIRLKNTLRTVWMGAKYEGKLVGVCSYRKTRYGINLKSIIVLRSYRKSEIYSKLFAERLKRVKRLNYRRIYGYCDESILPQFLKHGFTKKKLNYGYNYCELNYPYIETKIEFDQFCKIIQGKVVHGPKNINIHYFVKGFRLVRNPCTVVFFNGNQKRVRHDHLLGSSQCAIVFEKGKIKSFLPNVTYIMVENINQSYWDFVHYYRNMFDIPVFAITGTCGKTTVKEMIAQILGRKNNVVATVKSKNAPKRNLGYLTRITRDTDFAVYETPVNYRGLLEYNCKYFKPTIGMITNIGVDHLAFCGTLDNYIQAKGEIIKGLGYRGILILNSDDEKTKQISLEKYKGKIIYFGIHTPADYQAANIRYVPGGMKFILHHQESQYKAFVPGYGEHQVYNALSAICAVHQAGFEISEAIENLKYFRNVSNHMETHIGYNGSLIIDDTWNTNPTSIESAIKVLKNLGEDKKKIAVIGSISWLGERETEIHLEVGKMIADYNVDTLITYGPFANQLAKGAEGMKGEIFTCTSMNELKNILLPLLNQDTALLIKTSMKDTSLKPLLTLLKTK